METVNETIDKLMEDDEEFQNLRVSEIINLLEKTMHCSDLVTIRNHIITYINDNVANNDKGKNYSQVITMIKEYK
jgi:hypothetical protein